MTSGTRDRTSVETRVRPIGRARATSALACALLLSVVGMGCDKKAQADAAQAEKEQATLKAKLKYVDKIEADGAKHAPLTAPDVKPHAPGAMHFFYVAKEPAEDGLGNILFKSCQDLATMDEKSLKYRYHDLSECSKTKYLAVVQTRSMTEPVSNTAEKTFTPGSFSGDAFVYDLDSGEYVGGVSFSATNSATVQTSTGFKVLMEDLVKNSERAIEQAFATAGKTT